MKTGDYDEANAWTDVGRSLADFSARFASYAAEWKAIVRGARLKGVPAESSSHGSGRKASYMPEWKLSVPALKALLHRGGSATLSELTNDLGASLGQELTDADRHVIPSRGIPRWHRTLVKTHRLCQREGRIEKQKRADGLWKITRKGRVVAEETAAQASVDTA
jgi:hypothetical protein